MENNKRYAVIDRDGFFQDSTKVYSAHLTEAAAIRSAKQHKLSILGSRANQSTAMVIHYLGGFAQGQVIYRDSIRRQYPVVW